MSDRIPIRDVIADRCEEGFPEGYRCYDIADAFLRAIEKARYRIVHVHDIVTENSPGYAEQAAHIDKLEAADAEWEITCTNLSERLLEAEARIAGLEGARDWGDPAEVCDDPWVCCVPEHRASVQR